MQCVSLAFGTLRRSTSFYGRQLQINLIKRRGRDAGSFGQAFYHGAHQASITLYTQHAMIDEKVQIQTAGLRPGQNVTLFASVSEGGKQFGSCGHYTAGHGGVVDTLVDASTGGTFTGVESMGLFWSMKSKPGVRDRRLNKQVVMSPFHVSIDILDGFWSFEDLPWEGSGDLSLASCQLQRSYARPGVRKIPVEQDGLYGTLFLPPGDGPFPAVLDMFGFTNECIQFRSALLASHGIASFLLYYIGYKDLPTNYLDIDQHYFLRAFDYLAAHPKVKADSLGGIATCGGTSFLLTVAFKRPAMKCCVSINGTLLPTGKTQEVEGEMIKTADLKLDKARVIDGCVSLKSLYRPGYHEHFVLPAWRHGAQLLLVQGLADHSASPECLDAVMRLLPDSFSDSVQVLTYPGAGHLLEPPYTPHVFSNYNALLKVPLLFGGEPKLHAEAQEDSWPRILDFLHQNLTNS